MALISGAQPVGPRMIISAQHNAPTPRIVQANTVQPVPPVPATASLPHLGARQFPSLPYPVSPSKPTIEVDGIPSINDEAILSDDIVRPDPKAHTPDPDSDDEMSGTSPPLPMFASPGPVMILTTIIPDPQHKAQATPWPEALRILRVLPSPQDGAG